MKSLQSTLSALQLASKSTKGDKGTEGNRTRRSKQTEGEAPRQLSARAIEVGETDVGKTRADTKTDASEKKKQDAEKLLRQGFDTPIRLMPPDKFKALKAAVEVLRADAKDPNDPYLRLLIKQIAAVEKGVKKPRKETREELALRSLKHATPEDVLSANLLGVRTLLSHVALVLPLATKPKELLVLKLMSQALVNQALTKAAEAVEAAADADAIADTDTATDIAARRATAAHTHAKRQADHARKVAAEAVALLDRVSAAWAKAEAENAQASKAH